MFQSPVKVNNAGSIWIVDQSGNRVALVDQVHKNRQEALRDAQTIADAINNYLTNHTRRSDPQTSRLAELAMKDVLKNRYRRLALEYFVAFGPMSDEQLCDRFTEAEVSISAARVRHIRLELYRHKMLKDCGTTENRNNNAVKVYAVMMHAEDQIKKGVNGKANS